jgi:3-ketosteroid 9alpha-monooxygenase subunit A
VMVTPVEADQAEVRFAFTHPKVEPGSPQAAALGEVCARITDLPIPDNGVDPAGSASGDGDERSLRFRQWFEQFYIDEAEPQEAAAE